MIFLLIIIYIIHKKLLQKRFNTTFLYKVFPLVFKVNFISSPKSIRTVTLFPIFTAFLLLSRSIRSKRTFLYSGPCFPIFIFFLCFFVPVCAEKKKRVCLSLYRTYNTKEKNRQSCFSLPVCSSRKTKTFPSSAVHIGMGIALHELVKKKSKQSSFFFNNFQHVKRLSPTLTFTENLPSTIYFLSKQPTPYT